MSESEEMIQKVSYTLDSMIDKYEQLQEQADGMQAERIKQLAMLTRK